MWHKRYNEGEESIYDGDERSGCPVTQKLSIDFNSANSSVDRNTRAKSHELCDMLGMGYRILIEELGIRHSWLDTKSAERRGNEETCVRVTNSP